MAQDKVLIVGGTGFIGYHICRELVARGYLVTSLSLEETPADFLPAEVTKIVAHIDELSEEELKNIFTGHKYFVFAAGADDRCLPKAPAYPFFYQANVTSLLRLLQIAGEVGVEKAVVLNSYFAYFDRIWPEMRLAEHHPYIRSRRAQEEEAGPAAPGRPPVLAFLELPYIVGITPTKSSLWLPLVKYANADGRLKFYTKGGTAIASVRNVGVAAVNALELTTKDTLYQIADVNMTWPDWLQSLCADPKRKLKVLAVPNWLVKVGMVFIALKRRLKGVEGGLDAISFVDLQTRNTFLPVAECVDKLQYQRYDIREDFRDTVKLCLAES